MNGYTLSNLIALNFFNISNDVSDYILMFIPFDTYYLICQL